MGSVGVSASLFWPELIVPCYHLKIASTGLIDGHSNGSVFLISEAFVDVEALFLAVAVGVEVAVEGIVLVDGLGGVVDDPPVDDFAVVVEAAGSALGVEGEAEQCEDD